MLSQDSGMTDSAEMNLVFRLGGIGFVLPIDDLVEIREATPETPAAVAGDESLLVDLRRPLGLSQANTDAGARVVLCGNPQPWILYVEHIDGIFPASEFEHRPLPELLWRDVLPTFQRLALWRGEVLQACRAPQLEQFRGEA
ncbi:hypothetical protein JCM30471_36100 [Desulfuromonas carbonis]|uniref:chemotaxis protein CheW n=1 Tax=Desulfuromonas sp. DDH964 TaxID=1823759 RepID=UPI00078EF6CB|nr:hypothetical protein [Desulfuromonas sp. DDH964]AMV72966.1 hypothetical protein DBW_2642 [Desulfuromonas sp. DDH964]